MEQFTNCELDFFLVVLSRYFGFQVLLIGQFYGVISSEQKNDVLHELVDDLGLKRPKVNCKYDCCIHLGIEIIEIHFGEVFDFDSEETGDVVDVFGRFFPSLNDDFAGIDGQRHFECC